MGKYGRVLGWTVGIIAVVVLGLRAFLLKVWTIPDEPVIAASIVPSLNGGDVVLVLTKGTPGFGDLVRCADPEAPLEFVVGRIVGVEGDVVETEGATLTVNGKRYDAETACTKPKVPVRAPSTQAEEELQCDVVTMGGGWHYRGHGVTPFKTAHTRTDVGTGMVYLLSDDRDYHDDSRDFGLLPRASCTERIFFRLWSKAGWTDDQTRLEYVR